MSKIMTLYFSIKGQTIGPGMKIVNQEKGNCNIVAEYIQKAIGGELFEIKADRAYSKEHMVLIEEAKQELNNKVMVPVKEYPDDMAQYDTIFLVYPNWWNTIPMVVATFLAKYEWSGKTIFPVCTNEGSGLGNSVSDIKKYARGAKVREGVSFTGSQVSKSDERISAWAKDELK